MRFQQGRMDAGLTLTEASEETGIDAKYLYALEEEAWDDLPGKVFAMGYAKTYALFLGLNTKKISDAVAAAIDYDESEVDKEHIQRRLFKDEERIEKRNRDIKGQVKEAKKSRRTLFMMLISLAVLLVLAFIGSRLWI